MLFAGVEMVTTARRSVLIGAPLILGLLELGHPAIWPGDAISAALQPIATWWTALHVLQVPLFALLGLAVFLLVQDLELWVATVSRYAIIARTLRSDARHQPRSSVWTPAAERSKADWLSLDHEHGGLYGPGAEPVQGLLAGVSDIGRMSGLRHSLRIVECGTE